MTTPIAPARGPEASAGVLLTLLGRFSNRIATEALRPTGLKPRHLAVLTDLRDRAQTQQALGEATGTDPTKLVGLLNDLEAWALIVRRRDPADRRRHIVEISACGRERLAEVDRIVAACDDHLMQGLEPDERATLIALLSRAAANGGIVPSCRQIAAATDGDPDCAVA